MNEYPRIGWKAKTIKKHLYEKVNDWVDSIKDASVKAVVQDNIIVTGGSICSMLLGEKVNDYDIYFRNKEAAMAIAGYYCDLYNSRYDSNRRLEVREEKIVNCRGIEEERVVLWVQSEGIVEGDDTGGELDIDQKHERYHKSIERPKYDISFMSQNAISLTDDIQLIIRFFGSPEEIHNNYDFEHAMCWYATSSMGFGHLELKLEALENMLARTLVYRGSLYPIASIFRMKKFIERGWRITAGEQLKIMWQISEIDLSDPAILREQLTGVDMAYMWQLIKALKDVDSSKINSTYVGGVIDRIFN